MSFTPKARMKLNFLEILFVLLIIWGVLQIAFLLSVKSPETFFNHQRDLPTEKNVMSSTLELASQPVKERDRPPSFPPDLISIEQAITSIKQRYPGRVIRTELLINERGPVYEIDDERRDGTITIIEVDAQTGRVLEPLSNLLRGNNSTLSLSDKNEI